MKASLQWAELGRAERQCTAKRAFADRAEARAFAQAECVRNSRPAMWFYRCPRCALWHITNKPGPLRRSVTPGGHMAVSADTPTTPHLGGFWAD